MNWCWVCWCLKCSQVLCFSHITEHFPAGQKIFDPAAKTHDKVGVFLLMSAAGLLHMSSVKLETFFLSFSILNGKLKQDCEKWHWGKKRWCPYRKAFTKPSPSRQLLMETRWKRTTKRAAESGCIPFPQGKLPPQTTNMRRGDARVFLHSLYSVWAGSKVYRKHPIKAVFTLLLLKYALNCSLKSWLPTLHHGVRLQVR